MNERYNIKGRLDEPFFVSQSGVVITFRDYIIEGTRIICNSEMTQKEIDRLDTLDNKELNLIIEELEWLLSK